MQKKNYEQWKRDFVQRLEERIRQNLMLSSRGPVTIHVKRDINEIKREGIIMPNLNSSGISPAVYLDMLYMRYQLDEPEDALVEEVLSVFTANMDITVDRKVFFDYEQMKRHLRIRVNGAENNADWLTEMVGEVKGDFIYSCYLHFTMKEKECGIVNVRREMASAWNVSEEEIIAEARKNEMAEPVELISLEGVVNSYLEIGEEINLFDYPEEVSDNCIQFVLREANSPYGAAVLARDEVLKAAGELLQDDYYIMPSSIREVILVPARFGDEMEFLDELVREINLKGVEPQEILSDHAQYYDRKLQLFMNAKEYRRMIKFTEEAVAEEPEGEAFSPEQTM